MSGDAGETDPSCAASVVAQVIAAAKLNSVARILEVLSVAWPAGGRRLLMIRHTTVAIGRTMPVGSLITTVHSGTIVAVGKADQLSLNPADCLSCVSL